MVAVAIIVLFANEDVDVRVFDVFVNAVVVIEVVADTVDVSKLFLVELKIIIGITVVAVVVVVSIKVV